MSSVFYIKNSKRFRISINKLIDTAGKQERLRKTKLLPAGTTKEQAESMASAWESELILKSRLTHSDSEWGDYVESMYANKKSWIYQMVKQIKSRSVKKNFINQFNASDIKELLLLSNGKCAVTGVKFHTKSTGLKRPYFHSIDRIDSSQGYNKSNCRVVCFAVNVAMMAWGDEIFKQMAIGYVINKYCSFALVNELKI